MFTPQTSNIASKMRRNFMIYQLYCKLVKKSPSQEIAHNDALPRLC